MRLSNLILEVTRQCNMSCDHCLRGKATKITQSKENIDILFTQVDEINSVTFTGGEPSLNVPIMEYFLAKAKENNVYIGNFYIATNGLKVSEEFVMFCLKMYSYCDEKEMCSVQVSNDAFHSREGKSNIDLLQGLSFFSKKFDWDYYSYSNGVSLIKQGRSKVGRTETDIPIETKDDFDDSNIHINCNGEVINGCDWSYINLNTNFVT